MPDFTLHHHHRHNKEKTLDVLLHSQIQDMCASDNVMNPSNLEFLLGQVQDKYIFNYKKGKIKLKHSRFLIDCSSSIAREKFKASISFFIISPPLSTINAGSRQSHSHQGKRVLFFKS